MEKVDWCDRTTALSWFLLAELSSLTCPLLLMPIAVQNTNTVEYKYKYSGIRILMQIRGSFWQSCHRKQVLASPPLLFAPIAGHNTPESMLLRFCKSCPFKNPLPHEVRDTVSHDKHKKRVFAFHNYLGKSRQFWNCLENEKSSEKLTVSTGNVWTVLKLAVNLSNCPDRSQSVRTFLTGLRQMTRFFCCTRNNFPEAQ